MKNVIRHAGAAIAALAGLIGAARLLIHHRVTAGGADEWVMLDVAYAEWWTLALAIGALGLGGALALALARRSRAAWLAALPFFAAWMIGQAGHDAEYGHNPLVALAALGVGVIGFFWADAWARDRGWFGGPGPSGARA